MTTTRRIRRACNTTLYYLVLVALGIVMIFPLLYMLLASFKTNAEIFGQPLKLLRTPFPRTAT